MGSGEELPRPPFCTFPHTSESDDGSNVLTHSPKAQEEHTARAQFRSFLSLPSLISAPATRANQASPVQGRLEREPCRLLWVAPRRTTTRAESSGKWRRKRKLLREARKSEHAPRVSECSDRASEARGGYAPRRRLLLLLPCLRSTDLVLTTPSRRPGHARPGACEKAQHWGYGDVGTFLQMFPMWIVGLHCCLSTDFDFKKLKNPTNGKVPSSFSSSLPVVGSKPR